MLCYCCLVLNGFVVVAGVQRVAAKLFYYYFSHLSTSDRKPCAACHQHPEVPLGVHSVSS